MNITSLTEKSSFLGVIISAMGCTACFPLLGSLGASIGLGFLAQFEGLFINTLLPLFAVLALISVLVSWWQHQQLIRGLLGIAGPLMVLATLHLFWTDNWSTYMFYFAVGLMLFVGLWDMISPAHRLCHIEPAQEENDG